MAVEPTMFQKNYTEPFVLDRGKLSRMITIMEQKAREPSIRFLPTFEVAFKNNKRVVLHSIQDVLSLDNSIKNPIRALEVEAETPNPAENDGP